MDTVIATQKIAANLDELVRVRQFVEQTAVDCTTDAQAVSDIVLAVDEAVTNIIRHGYQHRMGNIKITVSYFENRLEIILCDWSPNFDPTQVKTPDPDAPLSERRPGGMGIHMIRQLMDEIQYQRLPDGRNQLTLIKQV